jgi:hypothetical protein
MSTGIYSITNRSTGRVYIGQTLKSFAYRWRQHRFALSHDRHTNVGLQDDWNSLGAGAFDFAPVYVLPSPSRLFGGSIVNVLEAFFIVSAPYPVYNEPKQFKPADRRALLWAVERGLIADVPGL